MFEHCKTSPNLLNKTISSIENMIVHTIAGNHDIPQHNYELIKKSGIETLSVARTVIPLLQQGHWGRKPTTYLEVKEWKIIVSHEMTYLDKEPYPNCPDPECHALFKKYPKADLIITGHNHETFVARKGDRLLINPGSLTRHKADQINHKPCVFLWNADKNDYKIQYLKIKENAMSREHIQIQNQKDQNIQNFLTKLKETWEVGLSFEDNIINALESNKIPGPVKEIILKWIEK
jgi:predicted phosphodiesterase